MAALRRERWTARFLKMGGISFLIHAALIAVFSLAPWHMIIQAQPTVYSVTLTSIALPAPEPVKPIPTPEAKPAPKEEKAKAVEKPPPPPEKKIEKPKKDDLVVKVKKPPRQEEKPVEEKPPSKSLREALEEVSKKKALDEINKRIATRREPEKKMEERPPARPSVAPSTPVTPVSPAPAAPAPRLATPQPLSRLDRDSKWSEYYGLLWAKIKEEWTIPQNLFKEMVDLETMIVVIIGKDGKIQKYFYDKRSGNPQYDETAMRAIKKADPLPPIPKELAEDTIEVGLRFTAEDYAKVD